MHPNSLKNLKPYPAGTSGNTGNRYNPIPEELRGITSLTQRETTKIISKYARMTMTDIEDCLNNPSLPVLDGAICSIFKQSVRKGDFGRLAFLLDRAIGKIKEIEQEEDSREELSKLSINELLVLVKTHLPEAG